MKTKFLHWLIVFVLVITALVMPATALRAVTPTATEPDDTMLLDTWYPVAMGEQEWLVFNYDGKKDPIEIHLYAKPTEGVAFRVLTPTQMEHWRDTGKIEAIGAGSYNEFEKSELFWTGEFNLPGTYYVLVDHSKVIKDTVWCKLTITGKGVSFPSATGASPYAPVASPIQPVADPAAGGGPDLAYLPGKWQEMREGVQNWFMFTYDKHASDPMIAIKFYAQHTEGVIFKVLTPEQAAEWRTDGKLEWTGVGTKDKSSSADLSWTGEFTTSGTYYVVVEHSKTSGETAYGKLLINGEGVTF